MTERDYIRVKPSRSQLSPSTVVKQIEGFHQVESSRGFLSKLNPLKTPPTWEFLAITRGDDEPVEFYYGVDDENLLKSLERRLSTLYPSAFKMERTTLNPEEALTPNGTVLDDTEPMGVKWVGRADRPKDWMTTIPRFSENVENDDSSSRSTLAPLIELLSQATHPIAFQVVFRRKPEWRAHADGRVQDLQEGTDTLFDKAIEATLGSPEDRDDRHRPSNTGRENYVDTGGRERAELIKEKNPAHTFNVNARALTLVESQEDEIDRFLNDVCTVFDTLQGPFYRAKKKRLDGLLGRPGKAYSRFLNREIKTGGLRRKTSSELVLNADELANFVVVPSSEHLTTEGSRGTYADPESRSPLPRPQRMARFREGMALDDNGEPESEPTRVPANLLREHYLRIGKTGTGKSKALINDVLSCYSNTDGPVILVDKKGDGMSQNYLRA
ncbi:MAG: conjugal transfer protein, partial [Halobacteria archaeon]|nr:conjugal transfer protein [Halobacteria archaeon]